MARDAHKIEGDTKLKQVIGGAVAVLTSPYRFLRWIGEWVTWWGATAGRRTLGGLLLVGLVLGGVLNVTIKASLKAAAPDVSGSAEAYYVPPASGLQPLALGHPQLLADLLVIRALVYFGDQLEGDRTFEWMEPYLDTILALDPNNRRLYTWAAQNVKLTKAITNEDIARSNAYLLRGIERFPDDWQLYESLGFNYFHEWKTDDAEEKARLKDKALEYYTVASILPGSQVDPNFVAEQYLRKSETEMALFHLYSRYWAATEFEKEQLRIRIGRYQAQAAADELKALDERKKTEYPYLTPGVFELLGPAHDGVLAAPRAREPGGVRG